MGLTIQSGKVVLAKTSSATVHAIGAGGFTVTSGCILQIAGTGQDQIDDPAVGTVSGGGATLDFNGDSEVFATLKPHQTPPRLRTLAAPNHLLRIH